MRLSWHVPWKFLPLWGVGDIEGFVDGEKAVVLGSEGIVETNPSDADWSEYTNQADAYQEELKRLREIGRAHV